MTRQGSARIAAVTGASRGIGRAATWELARRGCRVFALARSSRDLDVLAAETARSGLEVTSIPMDIADDISRAEAIQQIFAATDGYGADILVNSAGYGQFGPLEEVSIQRFRRQLEVNLTGLLGFTQPFLAGMRARRSGWIVNLSSAAGRTATPFMGPYNASKFGLEGMSDALRLELYPFNVHVVLVAPGPIRTAFGEAVVVDEHPSSPYAPYMAGWRRSRKGSDVLGRSAETVARVIIRAVESDHPRPRYTVTATAKLGAVARRLAPDTVTDWVIRHVMGLTRRPRNGPW